VLTLATETVGRAQDVDGPNATKDEVEVTTRDSDGWKEFKGGLKEYDVSVDHLWVPSNAALQAIRTAFLDDSELAATFLDEDGNGFSGTVIVTGMNMGQALADAVAFPVTLKGTGPLVVVGVGS